MCLTPINLKKETWKAKLNDTYHMQQVPCGKCLECLKARVNSWFVRIQNEKDSATSAYFVTLTYDDCNLSYSDNGNMCLNYRDTQLFWKALRDINGKSTKIKYFLVGEYGSKTYRPHYHAIVFNVTDPDFFTKAWKYGNVHVGKVSPASTYYTLKYALKRAKKIHKKDPFDDRTIEKALMSKGIGLNFLTEDMVAYYKEDVSRPVTMIGNKKLPLPRYYRDKLFTDKEKLLRNKLLIPHNEKRIDKIADPLFPQRVNKMYTDEEKKIKKTD